MYTCTHTHTLVDTYGTYSTRTCIKHPHKKQSTHTVEFSLKKVKGVRTAVITAALYQETLHQVANNNTNCRHTHARTHVQTHTNTRTHKHAHTCYVWRRFLKAIIRHMSDSQYHRAEELLGELRRRPCQMAGGDYTIIA